MNEILPFAITWMESERQRVQDFTYMWTLKSLIAQKLRVGCWLPEVRESSRNGRMRKVDQWVLSYSWMGVRNSVELLDSRKTIANDNTVYIK